MTEPDWWALCDLDPAAFPWPYFADWLDDRGDSRADAAREVGRGGWVPRYSHAFETWEWWLEGAATPDGPEDLPRRVFDRLGGYLTPPRGDDPYDGYECRCYRSPSAACRALLDALARALPR
jgi:hypothetical protein